MKLSAVSTPPTLPDHSKAGRVRDMFDRIARRYSLVNSLVSIGRDRYWRREAVRLAGVQPGERLLDVCCGPGELADAFAKGAPPPAGITACDFSGQMLAAAQRRQARRRRPLTLVLADATCLPFADGSFQLVSCAFGVRNLADPRAGLAEFLRVLTPGGRVVIVEFSMPGRGGSEGSEGSQLVAAGFRFYFHHVLPLIGGLVSGDVQAYRYLPRSVESFFSAKQLADMVKAAGFADVRQRPLTAGVAVVTTGRRPA